MIKIKLDVEIPKAPNFLRVSGIKAAIPVGKFSDDELKEIARLWTEELLGKAAHCRLSK